MKLNQTLLTAAALSCVAYTAAAQTTFIFDTDSTIIGSGLDAQSTGSFTVNGIEITVTTSADLFNATTSGFGINQLATGDDTDGFDFTESEGAGVAEGLTLSFSTDVQLVNFVVSSWGAEDEISLTDGVTIVGTITSTGMTSLANYTLSSSSTLTVMTTAGLYGNGWSLDSITVVPEPNAYALLAGIFTLGFVILRRRR